MRLLLRKPTQSLNKVYAKQFIAQDRMDAFRQALARLFAGLDENESEAYQKNIVASFLNDAFYEDTFEISTHDQIDLVIHQEPSREDHVEKSMPGVVINAKRVFAGEMITTLKNNVKALHELILYYFGERDHHPNSTISQLVITDVYNWFIFDENDFCHFFYNNAKLRKLYQIKQQRKDNSFFYGEVAKVLRDLDDEIPVTYVDLRKVADALPLPASESNRLLIPVYKLFSPEHLLKLPSDSTFNHQFYNELLHIVGLHETITGGRRLIQRLPDGYRHDGSLLENTITLLRVDNTLANYNSRNGEPHGDRPPVDETVDQYGELDGDPLFGIGLGLCITWLNRILFLKLLEGQLVRYHRTANGQGARSVQFLTARHIRKFDELNELFFAVLAAPEANRPATSVARYDQGQPGPVPYLNSSLFELTDLERRTLKINDLKDQLELPLFGQTVLKDRTSKRLTGQLPTLQYLLTFLDAYDFLSDGPAEVQPDNKPLINAATLGLIFEKLNGYRDGSFFTPGFIAMYMVRDAIRRAVVERFKESLAMSVDSVDKLADHLSQFNNPDDLLHFNAIVNRLRIVDPAVGSGRFLVSALNELIALKAELGILTDRTGRRLRHYNLSIENDELVITDENGEPFQYYAGGKEEDRKGGRNADEASSSFTTVFVAASERQRVQELIFHEKQILIENCLFGVDSNPNAISICRLRLWIELLKSAYYRMDGVVVAAATPYAGRSLQTLPNLDSNLRVGNSLVSRFGVGFRADTLRNQRMRDEFLPAFQHYRVDVLAYKHIRDRAGKDYIQGRIRQFGEFIRQIALADQKDYTEIRQLEAKLDQSALTFDFVNQDDQFRSQIRQLDAKKRAFAEKQRVFRQAFEWRFEFPEVLDDAGNFVGFDLVVSNPPYSRPAEPGNDRAQFSRAFPNTYAGAADPYVVFIEQGLNLLRPGGQFACLLPNKWMRVGYGAKLRKWLKTKAIEQITDFGSLPVLDDATICPSILAIRNANATGTLRAVKVDTLQFGRAGLAAYLANRTFTVPIDSLQDSGWVLADATVQNLLVKLKNTGVPLRTYVNDKIFHGIKTGLNEAFVIDAKTRNQLIADDPRSAEVIKPFLPGRDIKRYQTPVSTTFLILFERGITARERGASEPEDWLSQTYPAIYAWLKPFESKAIARADKGLYWWELRACDYYPEFEKPKLILPDSAVTCQATYETNGNFCSDKAFIFPVDDTYLLALLNAKIISFFYAHVASPMRGGYWRYKRLYVEQIPIPDVSAEVQAPLVALVDTILSAKRENQKVDTSALEAELDELVFGLYGLTAEERAVVKSDS